MPFIIILGIIAFLLMEHALVFWLVFVPLTILFVLFLLGFFKSSNLGLSNFAMAMLILVIMVIALMIACIPS